MAERKLTIRMNADTKNLQKGMATAAASTQSFGKSIQSGIVRHAAGIRMTGMAIAGLGVAMTGMAVLSIKAAADFQKQLANVSTMLDDVGMNLMPAYAEGLREMSKEFGESTETLSKGLYDILSASVDSSKAMSVLAVSAKLAAAGLTDTGIAADAITTIINSYAMAAEDAGKISDWMFSVVKRGKLTMAELAPSVGKVAATASIAGVSLEELGASIATITRAGIRSQEAMTAINGILRAFLKPTDDAAKAARDFGFELNTNTLRTIGFRGVLELLSDATAEQVAAMFPNIRGLKGVAAAMKDAEGFAKDYALMLNSAGMTEEAFTKQTSTLAFTFEQLKQEFADIFREIGTALIPIIKSEFIPLIKDVIEFIKGWVERFKALSPEMRKFLLVLGPILIALGGLIALLPTLAPIIAILLGPIGLIVAAIAGLTAAFIYFWTTSAKFRAVIKNIGEVFRVVFVNIWNYTKWFKDNWAALWATILMGAFNIIKNFGYNAWQIIKGLGERIAGWGSWFGKNFLNVWKNLFSMITTGLKNFGTNIVAQLGWLGKKMNPKNWFKKIERPDWTPLFEGLEAKWEEMPKIAELSLKKMTEGVKIYFEPLPELVKPVFAAIEEGAERSAEEIKKATEATKGFKAEWQEFMGQGKTIAKIFVMLKVSIHKTTGELADLKKAMEDAGKEYIPNLEEELADLEKRLDSLRVPVVAAEKVIKTLIVGIHKTTGELADLNKVLENAGKTYIPTLKQELADLESKFGLLRPPIEEVTKIFESLPVTIRATTGELADLNEAIKEAGLTHVPTLEEELADLEFRLGTLMVPIPEVVKEIKTIGVSIHATTGELADLNAVLNKTGTIYVPTLAEELVDLKKRLKELKKTTEDATDKMELSFKNLMNNIGKSVKTKWASIISDWIAGTKRWEDAWTEMWESLKKTAIGRLSEIVADKVWGLLEGALLGVGSWLVTAGKAFIAMGLDAIVALGQIALITAGLWLLVEAAKIVIDWLKAIWDWLFGEGSLWDRFWDWITGADSAVASLTNSINNLPKSFTIVGRIEMPRIPRIPNQFFDIIGVRRFETGGQTFQTGGITEPGELVLNKPITDWIRKAMSRPGPTGVIPSTGGSNISSARGGVTVNIPRGAVIVYGDIRTKMDEEEFIEKAGAKIGEKVGEEILRTVPL